MTEEPQRRVRRREDIDESGVHKVASELAPQLGSKGKILQQNEIDMRVLAVLNPHDRACLPYIRYRAEIDDVDVFKIVYEELLYTSPAEGGLGRRQIVQAIYAASGGKQAIDYMERPSWWKRNVTEKDWKKRAAKEGKEVV